MKKIIIMAIAFGLTNLVSCSDSDSKPIDYSSQQTESPSDDDDDESTSSDGPVVPKASFFNTDTDGEKVSPEPSGIRDKKDGVDYGTLKDVYYQSTTVGKKRHAIVLLPAGYNTSKKYPVVYTCHGIGQDEYQWEELQYMLGNLINQRKAKEMIMVMCNCRARENDKANQGTADEFSADNCAAFDRFQKDWDVDLRPYIEENFSVATGRKNTAIVGFSMGGRVALHLGLTLADKIGYVGAFCPAPGVFDLVAENNFKPINNQKSAIMIVAGTQDGVVGDNPKNYHNALTNCGVKHSFMIFNGYHAFDTVGKGFYTFSQYMFN